jgi:hypothetical protein
VSTEIGQREHLPLLQRQSMQRRAHLTGLDPCHCRLVGARYRRWRPVLACLWGSDHAPADSAFPTHRIHCFVVD